MRAPAYLLLPGLAAAAITPALAFAPPAPSATAPPAPVSAEQARFFESTIRPLLLERCAGCHGGEQQRGGLRVDSLAALTRGGGRGAALQPGRAAESLLLRAVRAEDGVPKMPPAGKLTDAEIAALERWIGMGAPWPQAPTGGAKANAGRHWSFQPIREPRVPAVKNAAWVKNPVDAFILAGLEAKGLKPSPAADRRTLIRRATFDLTGLPPTPAEVEAFVADRSPDAFARVVDRLLASPHYGEKWGRHWLDVARYADTNGMDENVHYGNAWRYRDYVVASFNRDRPYYEFLTEQVAGDLLPPAPEEDRRNEQLIATGFIAVGPKLISEVDDRKMEMDMVDEQLDTLGRTTMGMTFGCARCHDHKFDPITTEDYYGLAGIFKSTKTIQVTAKPRMWFEYPLPTTDPKVLEYEARTAAIRARLEAIQQAIIRRSRREPGQPTPEETAERAKLGAELKALEKDPPVRPAAMGVTEGQAVDLPVHIRGSFLQLGDTVPRRVPAVLAVGGQPAIPGDRSGRLELARWLTSPQNPLTGRVIVNRIWRWHFGQGLVRTPDNFGILGEKPSHPELLDWLATRFRKDGGSFKAMHRLLMLSNTYQQSSAPNPVALRVDPENRLRWRSDIRRLQVEELRDSLLAVSGTLDRTMGGSILPLKNREYVFDHTSKDNTRYDSKRRSLYIPVVRNNLYDVFQLFDFGDGQVPEGSRPSTVVAPQALFMMNSDFVADAAAALAESLLKRTDQSDAARVSDLHARVYGRPATPAEAARARRLLERFQQSQSAEQDPARRALNAWTWLCHTTLAANEFLYLR
jgi:hypothetical protein